MAFPVSSNTWVMPSLVPRIPTDTVSGLSLYYKSALEPDSKLWKSASYSEFITISSQPSFQLESQKLLAGINARLEERVLINLGLTKFLLNPLELYCEAVANG
jgi:hypothetical protein